MRTQTAIQNRMRPFRGNQHIGAWTAADDELLLREYPKLGRGVLRLFPGRTVASVQCRIYNLRHPKAERGKFSTTGIEWFLTGKVGRE